MSRWVDLGEGTTITYGCSLTIDVKLGQFVFLNRHVTVGHDAEIGAYSNLNPGVVVSGNDTLEEGVDVGTGTVIIQRLRVGAGTVVGAGASVINDLPANITAVGVPAQPIKELPDWRTR
jgi:acetyltransferase-like isoleucine patch superfamily enzyme